MQKQNCVLDLFHVQGGSDQTIPFYQNTIQAGFPSPADDYMEAPIDLNKELVTRPAATFMGRVRGNSMIDANIHDGDLLIIDKSITPKNGDVAVCFIDGEFTIKYIKLEPPVIWLVPANPEFDAIKVTPENEFMIWGIVTYSIQKHHKG